MKWLQPLVFDRPKESPRSYERRLKRYKKKVRTTSFRLRTNGLPDTSRRVIVDGREYRSISEASGRLGVSTTRLYAMEDQGLAQIL